MQPFTFDITHVPFSRYGSYIAFSRLSGDVYLRSVRGHRSRREIFRLDVLNDDREPVPFESVATPALLRLESEGGHVDICLAGSRVVLVRGYGVGLRLALDTGLSKADYAFSPDGERWEVVLLSRDLKYMLVPEQGPLVVDAPLTGINCPHVIADFLPDPDTGTFEATIEEFRSTWQPADDLRSFDAARDVVAADFRRWLDQMPSVPAAYAGSRQQAAYVTWSCVVEPDGHLTRPAMFMSKNWMTGIWNWDNYFNALPLAEHRPELAWDQIMIFFDHQDASGALPDAITDRYLVWTYCKPPVHGWALRRLMAQTDFIDTEHLRDIYEPLGRWTEWWLTYRDDDGDGIPQYNHGNDSGWDNASVFAARLPVEAPDLSAYLVIQMDVLAEIAARLGWQGDAVAWRARADLLLDKLVAHSWDSTRFWARSSGAHSAVLDADSLMVFLPLVLGERLPESIRSQLIAGLTQAGRFLTDHGFATENPASPYYDPDGYWRGPIWAPATLLLVDGLRACGQSELAADVGRRFCDMVSCNGMYENFNALTGEGLRDPAYTWTPSVFLVLAQAL